MAKALMQAGHHPDHLFGTSAGALNAAWLAAEPTLEGLEVLASLWTAVRRRDVFPLNASVAIGGLAAVGGGPPGQLQAAGEVAEVHGAPTPARDGVLPLTVVTTDLETGKEVLLDRGPAGPGTAGVVGHARSVSLLCS